MRLRALAVATAALAFAVPAAHADGDPASDFLLSQDVFFPFDAKIPEANQKQLSAVVADAKAKGFTIRVALIASDFDLGSVPSLFGKPKVYARFLGQELFFVYKGRLLTVMPNGYGVSSGGKALKDEQRTVDRLPPPGKNGAALTAAAALAVQKLAAAKGVQVPLPPLDSGSSTTQDRIVLALIVVALLALGGAGYVLRRVLLSRDGAASE
jgi:hypothetical protein